MAKEIERKWVLNFAHAIEMIAQNQCETKRIRQFYTQTEPDEIRYREVETETGRQYFKTVKSGSGISREETETEVSREEVDEACSDIVGNLIKKTRVEVLGLEVDFYHDDRLIGLVVAEKEFGSIKEANTYQFPIPGMAFDVTNDKRYKNKSLAMNGKPE